jgi:hypothetical protein
MRDRGEVQKNPLPLVNGGWVFIFEYIAPLNLCVKIDKLIEKK